MPTPREIGRALSVALAVLLLVGAVGCASPARRISRNPDVFAQFSAEEQEKIRQGTIDIGFTEPMVQMALGRPDRVYQRTTKDGVQEIWSYRELAPGFYAHSYAFSGLCPQYPTCRRRHCPYFHHAYRQPPRSIERMRVTFEQDVVAAIEVLEADGGLY